METIYNAYKLYSTGRRVKTPTIVFDLKDLENFDSLKIESDDFNVEQLFYNDILPNQNSKLHKTKFHIVRKDLPQDYTIDVSAEEEAKKQRDAKVIEYLSKFAARKFSMFSDKHTAIGLCKNKETEWKWSWCLVEAATNKHFANLSPLFDTTEESNSWIDKKIGNK